MKATQAVRVSVVLVLATAIWSALSLRPMGASALVATSQVAGGATRPVYSFGVVGGDGKFLRFDHRVPTPVVGIPGRVTEIATSNSDSYALTSDGHVWAWGAGGEGELGNGHRTEVIGHPVEVRFPSGVRITSLANPMPYDSALAIDSTGHVWGWGYDTSHSLCLTRLRLSTPQRLPLSSVTMATGAGGHSMFLTNGHLYSCGLGSDGELGDASTTTSQAPVAVVGLPAVKVVSIQSAWQDSGVLLANGHYYDWGYNREGQLGDGTTVNRSVPVEVALPSRAVDVSQGGSTPRNGQTLALLQNGSIWDWGANRTGQLGDGTTRGSDRPLLVTFPRPTHWVSVCSGGYSSYALGNTGQAWAWGGNSYGQLGIGSRRSYQKTPARVRADLAKLSATASNVTGLSESQ